GHRAHLAEPRGGGAEPRRELGADVPQNHPAPQHARARLRLPPGLQRVDERLRHAGPDGRPSLPDGRPGDLRRGSQRLQLAGGGEPDHRPVAVDAGAGRPRLMGHAATSAIGADAVNRNPPRFLWPLVVVVYVLLLAPLVVVIAVSFGSTATFDFPPVGLSLRWYRAFFASEMFVRSFFHVSQVVGLATAFVATVAGTLSAIGLVRLRFPGRGAVETFFLSPLLVPHILLGAAVYLYLARLAWPTSSVTLLVGHIVIATPYVIRCVTAGPAGVGPRPQDTPHRPCAF